MTYEEAIRKLKQQKYSEYIMNGLEENNIVRALSIAIKAIELQIPTKPKPYVLNSYLDACPSCGMLIHNDCKCCDCGQKIDWSDN